MKFIDTHSHIYLEEFAADRAEMLQRANASGVSKILLPNIDIASAESLLALSKAYPDACLPMLGLHPTSVQENFSESMESIISAFGDSHPIAIGETGIDLYWDTTHEKQQKEAFAYQIELALERDLPIVIHSRNSLQEVRDVLMSYAGKGLRGVMHCFPGDADEAEWFVDFGLYLGVGGVVSYKKSAMARMVERVDLKHIVLETDAPYLPPVPHRGKRNEPAFLIHTAQKIAEIKNISTHQVAETCTQNSEELFNLNS